jgi:hypothetical protein
MGPSSLAALLVERPADSSYLEIGSSRPEGSMAVTGSRTDDIFAVNEQLQSDAK